MSKLLISIPNTAGLELFQMPERMYYPNLKIDFTKTFFMASSSFLKKKLATVFKFAKDIDSADYIIMDSDPAFDNSLFQNDISPKSLDVTTVTCMLKEGLYYSPHSGTGLSKAPPNFWDDGSATYVKAGYSKKASVSELNARLSKFIKTEDLLKYYYEHTSAQDVLSTSDVLNLKDVLLSKDTATIKLGIVTVSNLNVYKNIKCFKTLFDDDVINNTIYNYDIKFSSKEFRLFKYLINNLSFKNYLNSGNLTKAMYKEFTETIKKSITPLPQKGFLNNVEEFFKYYDLKISLKPEYRSLIKNEPNLQNTKQI